MIQTGNSYQTVCLISVCTQQKLQHLYSRLHSLLPLLYLNLLDFLVCCIRAKAFWQHFLFKVLWEDRVTFALYQMIIFPLTAVSHNNAENRIIRSFLIKHVSGMVCVCSFL